MEFQDLVSNALSHFPIDSRPRQFRTKSADPEIHPACTLPPHLQQGLGEVVGSWWGGRVGRVTSPREDREHLNYVWN